MAERPVVTAVLGTLAATLEKVKSLGTIIRAIEDAPGKLKRTEQKIRYLTNVLAETASTLLLTDNSYIYSVFAVKTVIDDCDKTCTEFQALLSRWEWWYVAEKDEFWTNRWRRCLYGYERVASFEAQLQLYHRALVAILLTCSTAIHCETDTSKVNTSRMGKYARKELQRILNETLHQANAERVTTETTLQRLPSISNGCSGKMSEQAKMELQEDLRQQMTLNESFRKICEQALKILQSGSTGQTPIEKSLRSQSSLFLSDFIGRPMLDHEKKKEPICFGVGLSSPKNSLGQEIYNQRSAHVCCFMLGILDIVYPSNEKTRHCAVSEMHTQSNNGSINLSEHTSTSYTESPATAPSYASASLSAPPTTAQTTAQTTVNEQSDCGPLSTENPKCWDHGCNGRLFSSWSNLRRHQREKARKEPVCFCSRCGAFFSRTSSRDKHLAQMSCSRIRRYSNGRKRRFQADGS